MMIGGGHGPVLPPLDPPLTQTHGQTDRHDQVHDQPLLSVWRLTIEAAE